MRSWPMLLMRRLFNASANGFGSIEPKSWRGRSNEIRTDEPAVWRRGLPCKLASGFSPSHALTANMARSENDSAQLVARVEQIVASTPILDVHTHLYDPAFGNLLLWGIDDLLV